DWELATVGSPLMDLGCSLAYWVEKNDAKEMQMIRRMPTNLDGMWSRKQIVEYYCLERNISSEGFDYFYIFGLFRLAVIAQQIYKRYATGKTSNSVFANFGDLVKALLRQAEKQI
ncbi:MAG TPA: phosphotransferase family protein, partial [Gammaproteobacteria bacterium]|nr:phosphotransferase family protein [Gammaproteobacteria bacterium]